MTRTSRAWPLWMGRAVGTTGASTRIIYSRRLTAMRATNSQYLVVLVPRRCLRSLSGTTQGLVDQGLWFWLACLYGDRSPELLADVCGHAGRKDLE